MIILENVGVKNYIDERMKQIESDRIASAAEVLQYLTSVLRGESRAEFVVVEGDGEVDHAAQLQMMGLIEDQSPMGGTYYPPKYSLLGGIQRADKYLLL